MFTIVQLEYFLEVARQLSFTKAAETFYSNQTTISRSISQLEKQLGVQLFERSTRKISLTDAGLLLQKRGTVWLQEQKAIEEAVIRAGRPSVGYLRLCTFNFFNTKVNDLLQMFQAEHPNIQIIQERVIISELNSLIKKLTSNTADLAILCSFHLDHFKLQNYTKIPIVQDCMSVMLKKGHPLAKGKTYLTSQDISQETILACQPFFPFLEQIGNNHVEIKSNVETLVADVRSGAGCAIFPKDFALEYQRGLDILDFYITDETPLTFDYCFSYNDKSENPALNTFVNWLSTHHYSA